MPDLALFIILLQSIQAVQIVTLTGGAKVLSGGTWGQLVCTVLVSDQIHSTSCVSHMVFQPSTIVKMWLDLLSMGPKLFSSCHAQVHI